MRWIRSGELRAAGAAEYWRCRDNGMLAYGLVMSLVWEQITVAALDPVALGRWWCEALGWVVVDDGPVVFEIQPEEGRMPGMLFVPAEATKAGQNRVHVDLRPDGDQGGEVERLIGLGASRADIGQADVPWVVLADPEGNEFCVLAVSSD